MQENQEFMQENQEAMQENQEFTPPPQQVKPVVVPQRAPAEWSTGLFDCCAEPGGVALCAVTALLPCFVNGKNGEQIGYMGGYWGGFCSCLVPVLECFCVCAHAVETLKARNGGVAPDNDVFTAVESVCCNPCVTCRTRREQMLTLGKSGGYMPGSEQSAAMMRDGKVPVHYSSVAQYDEVTEDVV